MQKDKYKKYIEEADERANRNSAKVFMVIAIALIPLLILNEIDVFHIDKIIFRISMGLSFVLLLTPYSLIQDERFLRNRKTKYFVLYISLLVTCIIATTTNFHSTLVLILPIFISAQYHSRKMSRISIAGSCLVVIFSQLVSYLMHLWDIPYLEMLLQTGSALKISYTDAVYYTMPERIWEIILYIVIPKIIMITLMGLFCINIMKINRLNIDNQYKIMELSEKDVLTGLFNRYSFEKNLSVYPEKAKNDLYCVYFDVTGLHEINNKKGHEAGDKMLVLVADIIKDEFGEEDSYRTGGDEFISFRYDCTNKEVSEKISKIKETVTEAGYNVSAGFYRNRNPKYCRMQELVKFAESEMYEDKKTYYENSSHDRRRNGDKR